MLKRYLLFTIAISLAFCLTATAQTVEELIQKNLDAHGGLDKLRKVQSVKITGKMTMQQGMEAPFIMQKKRPDLLRLEFSVGGVKGIQAYDGENAWAVMPFMGVKDPQKLPKEQTDDLMEEADFDGPLIDHQQKGHTLELVGKEDVEGTQAHKIKLTRKDGKVRYYYLDPDSGLEVKLTTMVKREGVETSVDSYFANFQEVEGLLFPFSIQQKIGDAPGPQFTIEQMELNTEMDDSIFKMPAPEPAK